MAGTVTKAGALRSDQNNYDGTLNGTRTDSTGGTLTGLKVGNTVDVLQVFGAGDTANQNLGAVLSATRGLGTQNVALEFAPGTWTIDDDITIAANFTIVFPAGCIFDVAAGKTVTISGIFFRQHNTYSSGSGTFTISGTDILAPTLTTLQQLSGVAGTNTITATAATTLSAYAVNDAFLFTPANDNTGATTLNIDGVGAGAVQLNGAALIGAELQSGVPVIIQTTAATPVFEIIGNGNFLTSLLEDITPQLGAALDTNSFSINESKGAAVVAATTTNIFGGDDGNTIHVTGNTQIDDFTDASSAGQWRKLIFDGTPQVTSGSGITVFGGTRTAVAGDMLMVFSDTVSAFDAYWIKADGKPVVSTGVTLTAEDTTTGGTSIVVGSIPSGVTKIIFMTEGYSTTGTSLIQLQLGDAGGIETSGYNSSIGDHTTNINSTAGLMLAVTNVATEVYSSTTILTLKDVANNTWMSVTTTNREGDDAYAGHGVKSLSDVLTQIALTTAGGSETFDINSGVSLQHS